MGLKITDLGMDEGSRSDDKLQNLLKCILNEFSDVSKKRLHNLAFLSEYEYSNKFNGQRLTSVVYRPYLEGVYSEEIERALEHIEGVEHRRVRIGKEQVKTLKIRDSFECGLKENENQIVSAIVNEYGEAPPAEIQRVIASIDSFDSAGSWEEIEFSPVDG